VQSEEFPVGVDRFVFTSGEFIGVVNNEDSDGGSLT
jgi:hypothetical protein